MQPSPRLLKTLLGRKPSEGASWVALASVWLCAVASVVYWKQLFGISHLLTASGQQVFGQNEWWRLFTTMLVHADTVHLAVNSIALAILAWLAYGFFGTWIYPVLTVILGALVNWLALRTYPPAVTLMGASGVVYILAGLWLSSYFFIERQHSIGHRLLRLTGFSLVMLLPATLTPGVSYRTHAIGAAVGVVFGIVHFLVRKPAIRAAEVYDAPPWGITSPNDEDENEEPPGPSPHTIH